MSKNLDIDKLHHEQCKDESKRIIISDYNNSLIHYGFGIMFEDNLMLKPFIFNGWYFQLCKDLYIAYPYIILVD